MNQATFEDYYEANRCPGAPENPEAVRTVANSVIATTAAARQVTPEQCEAEVYHTLGRPGIKGLFHYFDSNKKFAFDPTKKGHRPDFTIEDQFLLMFARRFKRNLRRAADRLQKLSDQGRQHPAYENNKAPLPKNPPALRIARQSRCTPATGSRWGEFDLYFDETDTSLQERMQAVEKAKRKIPLDQRCVINTYYGSGLSFRSIARAMGKDHKFVIRLHDEAIANLKRLVG